MFSLILLRRQDACNNGRGSAYYSYSGRGRALTAGVAFVSRHALVFATVYRRCRSAVCARVRNMARQDVERWACMCERGVYSSTGFTTSSCTKHVDRRLLGRHYHLQNLISLAGRCIRPRWGAAHHRGMPCNGVNRNNYPHSAHSLQNTTIRQALAMWLFALQHWWQNGDVATKKHPRTYGIVVRG